MKKLFSSLLVLGTLISLAGCSEPAAPAETTPKKDYSQYAGIVADSKTWYEEFMALPIANDSMTEGELRQLCVDAFAANMRFTWTPNKEINYSYKLSGNIYSVTLPTGIAYSGLAYATGQSSGHIYKILKYYDHETGVLDVEAMDPSKVMSIVTSACARGAEQGWNRVCNSSNLGNMDSFSQYNSHIVPVGPYTYDAADYNYDFGTRTATSEILAKNDPDTMYESYALMKPADGLYSSPSWHVMMCGSEPVVVRNAAGKIDPTESYMLILEQEAVGTRTDKRDITQDNGVVLRQLGTVNEKFTFKKLLDKGYIPFTFKEFLGQDPVEPGESWLGTDSTKVESGTALNIKEISGKTLFANYAICVVEFQVKDPAGNVLYRYSPEFVTVPTTYKMSIQGTLDETVLSPYADGKNTIHVYTQLANGELLETFQTVLKIN